MFTFILAFITLVSIFGGIALLLDGEMIGAAFAGVPLMALCVVVFVCA